MDRTAKILMLVENCPGPSDSRVWAEATALRDAGFQVSIIGPKGTKAYRESYMCLGGIHVYQYRVPTSANRYMTYLAEYGLALLMTFLLSFKVLLRHGFDVIHAANPPDLFFVIGLFYRLLGKKFVFDQHDLSPEVFQVKFKGSMRSLHKLLLFFEWCSYRTAHLVITPNAAVRRVAIERGRFDADRVFAVRNVPELERLKPVTPEPGLKRGRRYLLAFVGAMEVQDGVEHILYALHDLLYKRGRRDVSLVMMGAGGHAPALRALARELALDEFVHFTGWIEVDDIVRYLSVADVGLTPEPANGLNEYCTMVKTMEYMALGKPVVAFDLAETRRTARGAALYAIPNRVEDFAGKIATLLDDEQLRVNMGALGRKRIEEELNWDCERGNLLLAYKLLFPALHGLSSKVWFSGYERKDTMHNGLTNHLPSRSPIAVVGLGKIGLPLAVQFARQGRPVIGCDINPAVVEKVNAGQSPIDEEPELAAGVAGAVQNGLLSATLHVPEAVRQAGVVVVIVPVVIDARHEVSFDTIDAATAAIGAGLRAGTLVIYETTLPVGTTARRFTHLLERASGLRAGHDFLLAYSPERVKSGRIFRDLATYPKVVGGIDERSTAAAVEFYRSVLDAEVIAMPSTDEAEFVKLIETTYRDVNIALANEFACFADAHGLNLGRAIAAANTQPESHIHTPGIGVGGHCIPVYPYFLLSGLAGASVQTQVAELPMLILPRYARRINDSMAEYAVHRLEAEIGSLAQQSVLILGVAYRGNVRELAFSSAELLRNALLEHGARVYADDPLFSEEELRALGYTPLRAGTEGEIRAIILQADHRVYRSFDFKRFDRCRVVLDGRSALSAPLREMLDALGVRHLTIGDGEYAGLRRQTSAVPATVSVSGEEVV